jgi:hypothetical protein
MSYSDIGPEGRRSERSAHCASCCKVTEIPRLGGVSRIGTNGKYECHGRNTHRCAERSNHMVPPFTLPRRQRFRGFTTAFTGESVYPITAWILGGYPSLARKRECARSS